MLIDIDIDIENI